MAKRIKFPLEMGDGTQVRSMEELKAHFDIDKVVEYTLEGKLVIWLEDRYYMKEAEAVKLLDIYSAGAKGELCAIFGVEISDNASEVDVEAIQLRKERLLKLKEYTDREEIWDKIDNVAFDQEELGDRLDEDCQEIYLCGDIFHVPYVVSNITYIGINQPKVFVDGDGELDIIEQNIEIKACDLVLDNLLVEDGILDDLDFVETMNDTDPFEGYRLIDELYKNNMILRIYSDTHGSEIWKFLVLDLDNEEYQKFEPESIKVHKDDEIFFWNLEQICIRRDEGFHENSFYSLTPDNMMGVVYHIIADKGCNVIFTVQEGDEEIETMQFKIS